MAKSKLRFKQLKLAAATFAEDSGSQGGIEIKTSTSTTDGVLLPQLQFVANNKILANVSGSPASAAAGLDFVDDDTFAGASATALPSAQSVKAYVDGKVNGLAWKEPVKALRDTNLAMTQVNLSSDVMIAAAAGHLAAVGESSFALNDRVLFSGQSNQQQNGIFEISTLGEGRHFTAILKIDTTGSSGLEMSDFDNDTIKFQFAGGSAEQEEFIFENDATATGTPAGGLIAVQIQNKTRAEDIVRELANAIIDSDSAIKDVAQLRIISFTEPSSGASQCVFTVESLDSNHSNLTISYPVAMPTGGIRNEADDANNPTASDAAVAGQYTRTKDCNSGSEMDQAAVFVAQSDAGYVCTSQDLGGLVSLDSTQSAWAQFTGAGQLSAGNLIDISAGGEIAVDLSESVEAAIVDGDYLLFLDGGATGTHGKEAVADLATLFAGAGLTAASSVISISASGVLSGNLKSKKEQVNINGAAVIAQGKDLADNLSYSNANWRTVCEHPMTGVYLNGQKLVATAFDTDNATTVTNTTTDSSAGDYWLDDSGSGNHGKIHLDASLISNGDIVEVIFMQLS